MDKSTKDMLIVSVAAIASGWGGSLATARIGQALGVALGPWGRAAGSVIGALVGTAVAKKMLGNPEMMSELESKAAQASSELEAKVAEASKAAKEAAS